MNYILLTHDPLDICAINELVTHDSCGAISLFVGITRDKFDGKKVLSLEYEAYEPMAVKQLHIICDELRSRWKDLVNIAIYHRLGEVSVREASVVIATSAPHRQSAIDSIGFAMDQLKRFVPIWKKEKYEDGSAWKENKECQWISKDPNDEPYVKRSKLDFTTCDLVESFIPNKLVQIAAEENEILRRIQCFVVKKREDINLNNILDFSISQPISNLSPKYENNREVSGCARTNSIIVKQEESKCHLRVRQVENRIGPQTRPDYMNTLNKLMTHKNNKIKHEYPEVALPNTGLQERLITIESYLNTPRNKTNFHKRLKAIESIILLLESISPEYKHFLNAVSRKLDDNTKFRSQCSYKPMTYSHKDLCSLIGHIKQCYLIEKEATTSQIHAKFKDI